MHAMLWAQSCSTEGAVAPHCCSPRGCRAGSGIPCTHCKLMEGPADVSLLSSMQLISHPKRGIKTCWGQARLCAGAAEKRDEKLFFFNPPPPPPCCGFGICIYLLVLFLAGMDPLFGAGIPSPTPRRPFSLKADFVGLQ